MPDPEGVTAGKMGKMGRKHISADRESNQKCCPAVQLSSRGIQYAHEQKDARLHSIPIAPKTGSTPANSTDIRRLIALNAGAESGAVFAKRRPTLTLYHSKSAGQHGEVCPAEAHLRRIRTRLHTTQPHLTLPLKFFGSKNGYEAINIKA